MRSAVVGTKWQPNNNRSRVHDSVNNPRLRSSSLPHGPDLGAQYACPFRNRATPQEIFHFPVRFPLPDSALLGEMNHRHRKAIQDSPGRKSSGNLASIKRERGKTMKILRIPLVIVLLVVAGRGFNANAQVTETNLHSFVGYPTDGAEPTGGLVQGSDGNFYGTTYAGGTYGGYLGGGTVFRISPSGSVTNLHSFVGPPTDGIAPYAGLVQGSDGNFYGTTYEGGANGGGTNVGGTVFRISPSGTYTNLHSFTGTNGDGVFPYAPLVQGSDGNFYGTTDGGGTSGSGTVFRISPSGTYTNLHSFTGTNGDGVFP